MNQEETHGHTEVTGAVMVLRGGAGWQVVAPAVTGSPHLLTGVAAASPTEIWAVGNTGQQPLAARWDGAAWTLPPGPAVDAALVGAGLQGIALASASSPAMGPLGFPQAGGAGQAPLAVAVGGGYDRLAGTEVPIIRHWDGAAWAPWTAWSAPGLDRGYVLTDVAITGAEAWAVGHGFPWGAFDGPVALRWTGSDWLPAAMPRIPKGKLLAVSATAPDDVWAVGAADRSGLVMRFDGTAWSQLPSPSTPFPLRGVAALSPTDVWAVGRDQVLHWNGRKWARVKAPVTGANTITARSSGDVWVAGGQGELAHFDGRRWTLLSSPHPLGTSAVWLASTAGADGVWAVGTRQVARTGGLDDTPSYTARSGDN